MGQSINKLASGSGERKAKEFAPILEAYYDGYIANRGEEDLNLGDFYRIICETVEEINKKLGNTQFRVPKVSTLRQAYETHHQGRGKSLTKEEFQQILQEVIVDTGFTGVGAKDILLYIFGVPVLSLLIKQRVLPRAVSNEIFIPAITSATVFVLARFNKI
ncbi:uncharacterized protein LOC116195572 [Punica granatum]|uniref:Uncharacterized protein n=2 Tax=Punica granatum TaxID=22663 RepID=A0A2I0HJT5_PUNGR|nr:uncharacterized protein LOC116195572 [Punica granatum]PKI31964.1 hypothetical protein CRG98_047682 [Punica granatum]